MNKQRMLEERTHWDKLAKDPKVDAKYISDITEGFEKVLGKLKPEVLEIGCGVGRLMKEGYYGIDISPNMLEIARKRKPNCFYRVCDGRSIPFGSDFFTSVYCVLVFQHLPIDGVSRYIEEVGRVLKKGGIFKFQFIKGHEEEPYSYHYSIEKILKLLDTDFNVYAGGIQEGVIHPQWTWITAERS